MKNPSEPVIFFGSGPVAAKSLESLANNFTVHSVVTKPAPPQHRGSVPVKELAEARNLTTHFVKDKADLVDLFNGGALGAIRIGVLVDFGIIVPRAVIEYFPLGIINSHFSLLPELRGADPITFAILNGQKVTGVSLMLLVEAMDEGPLLAQSTYELAPAITTPQLTDELTDISNAMLTSMLPLYIDGELLPCKQDTSIKATYSRKLKKDDGKLDWDKSAAQLEREVRAFIGWPRSYTTIKNIPVIVTQAHIKNLPQEPGVVASLNRELVVGCGEQSLVLDRVKPAGKGEMSGSDFLLGYSI